MSLHFILARCEKLITYNSRKMETSGMLKHAYFNLVIEIAGVVDHFENFGFFTLSNGKLDKFNIFNYR